MKLRAFTNLDCLVPVRDTFVLRVRVTCNHACQLKGELRVIVDDENKWIQWRNEEREQYVMDALRQKYGKDTIESITFVHYSHKTM